MSETDSFIDEVTEEVRRDRLFLFFRRYAWIAVSLVVLIVGGAAYNEWRKSSIETAAQNLGDAVTSALAQDPAEARIAALDAVVSNTDPGTIFVDLLKAAEMAEVDRDGALVILDAISQNPEAPENTRALATLKAVVLRGNGQTREQRLAVLDSLTIPGAPFRVIALEQKALALYEYGNNDDAIAILLQILDEPQATQPLLQRAQQLIIAMGGALPEAEPTGQEQQ